MRLYAVFCVLWGGLFALTKGVQVTIEQGKTFCFYMNVRQYHQGLSLNYEIVQGHAPRLYTTITSPAKRVIYAEWGKYGRHNRKVEEDGEHKICFDNSPTDGTAISVGFSAHADDPTREVVSNANVAKIAHAEAIENQVYDLNSYLDTVRDTQQYMKAKLIDRHSTAENTSSRVMWWSFAETIALIGIAAWKIYSLKRTFEVKRLL